ncbi:MAG: hypothetical protein M1442_04410 [Candidatus Thermoplasmatota archaeon]|nr:hypothetical protein [Candidatus Thermoplasmatota archaeon]
MAGSKTYQQEAVGANISTSFYGFNFPYIYEQPKVPRNVGVQGISGLSVPYSNLGPIGKVGPTGHLGPANVSNPLDLASAYASVSVLVYNGTLHPLSRSVSVDSTVTFQNISFYKFYTNVTSSKGYANFTIPEGWYFLTIRGEGSAHLSFSQEIDISGNSETLTRYLMPSSNSTYPAVGNGPAGTLKNGYINVNFGNGQEAPQISVYIYNGSTESGTPLVKGVTNSLGYANYSGLSSSYSYSYRVIGSVQSATGTDLYLTNLSGSFSAGNDIYVTLNGRTYWTASVSGPAPAEGYENSIALSGNIVYKGGVVVLSAPFSSSSYSISFVNAIVYLNSTVTWLNTPHLYFYNTTVFELSGLNPFGIDGVPAQVVRFVNSIVFFSSVNVTAVQFSPSSELQMNDVQGPWIAGSSYGSIFEAPFSGDPNYANLAGYFNNSEFYRFNMTSSNVPGTHVTGYAHLNNVEIINSTIESAYLAFDHSNIRGLYSFNEVNTYWYNDSNVSFLNFGDKYITGSELFATHDMFSTMLATTGGVTLNPQFANVTYSIFNFTPESASLHWTHVGLGGTYLELYDDFLISYPNITIRKQILNLETGSYQGWGMSIVPQYLQMNYSWLYGMDAIGFEPSSYIFNWNFSHDNFSNGWSDQEWNPFEWFTHNVTGYLPTASFNNDTFYGFHYDPAIWWKQWNLSTDVSIGYFQDLNLPNPPTATWGRIYMNYSTIYNVGIGTNNGYAFGMSEGGIASYFNDNVFLNDPYTIYSQVGTGGWVNGSYMQIPFANDIEHAAGSLFMTNNWFLNLTNQTTPTASVIGSGGQGRAVSISVSNNHYFYYPNTLQAYIPTFTTPPTIPFDNNSKYNFPPGVERVTHANYSYEIPINYYGKFYSTPLQDQYVFNSTVLQQNPFNYNPASVYAHVIEPDVNTSAGYPIVFFDNGLVGGVQPNFTWNDSSYQLAVEPNMTYIKSSQSTASKIGLEFTVPAGFLNFNIWMYNITDGKDQLVKSIPESNQSSQITVIYNPADMPQEAVFFANQSTGYKITFSQSGLPAGTAWSVKLGGVTAASTSGSIMFYAGNGSYTYTIQNVQNYYPSPSSGQITISGQNTGVFVKWSERFYDAVFIESGLPINTRWLVTLNGFTKNSTQNLISFSEANGTYDYAIGNDSGYQPEAPAGLITVNGSNATVDINFNINTHRIVFQVFGLTGQNYSITLNGTIQTSNSSRVVFNEPAGTYSYYIKAPKYFTANITSGVAKVTDHDYYVNISFNPEKIELINSYNIINVIPPLFIGFVVASIASACFMFIYRQKIKEGLKHLMREKN